MCDSVPVREGQRVGTLGRGPPRDQPVIRHSQRGDLLLGGHEIISEGNRVECDNAQSMKLSPSLFMILLIGCLQIYVLDLLAVVFPV